MRGSRTGWRHGLRSAGRSRWQWRHLPLPLAGESSQYGTNAHAGAAARSHQAVGLSVEDANPTTEQKAVSAGKATVFEGGGAVAGAWGGAVVGAEVGAVIGSVFPGPGTAIGGIVGGLIGGAIGSGIGEKIGAGAKDLWDNLW